MSNNGIWINTWAQTSIWATGGAISGLQAGGLERGALDGGLAGFFGLSTYTLGVRYDKDTYSMFNCYRDCGVIRDHCEFVDRQVRNQHREFR